jgi:hypothetical protein
VGPYTAPQYYNPDNISISNRQAFYTWYDQQKNKSFDFEKKILDYCISDVNILCRRCAQLKSTLYALVRVNLF